MNQTGINRTSDIILYAYPFRSRAERVIWALNELELEYRLVRLDPLKGENRTETFLRLNPGGKIPVLVHGEMVVTESVAVMEYVDSIATPGSLIPADPGGQSRYRQLVYFMMSEIESYLWIADQATRLKRIYSWPQGTAAAALERAGNSLPILAGFIEDGEYLVNDTFSAADIYAYHLVTWASSYRPAPPGPVAAYLDRLENRPACPDSIKPRME